MRITWGKLDYMTKRKAVFRVTEPARAPRIEMGKKRWSESRCANHKDITLIKLSFYQMSTFSLYGDPLIGYITLLSILFVPTIVKTLYTCIVLIDNTWRQGNNHPSRSAFIIIIFYFNLCYVNPFFFFFFFKLWKWFSTLFSALLATTSGPLCLFKNFDANLISK